MWNNVYKSVHCSIILIVKEWQQCNCTGQKLLYFLHIYKTEYYATIKKNEAGIFEVPWYIVRYKKQSREEYVE